MVELAGKPVHELLDILAGRSGVEVTPQLRHEFFTVKSRFYLDHAREVGRGAGAGPCTVSLGGWAPPDELTGV